MLFYPSEIWVDLIYILILISCFALFYFIIFNLI